MPHRISFPIDHLQLFKSKLRLWASASEYFLVLDSNEHKDVHGKYEAIVAVGASKVLTCNAGNAFEALSGFRQSYPDQHLFGYLGYDLKNELENLASNNQDPIGAPDLQFFIPEKIYFIQKDSFTVWYDNPDEIVQDFIAIENVQPDPTQSELLSIQKSSKKEYLAAAAQMLQHIQRGDIYEANLCVQRTIENIDLNTALVFEELNTISQAPMAAFGGFGAYQVLCSSPERYVQRKGTAIISQPIKGTARRSEDVLQDQENAEALQQDQKERSENVMIVDLVRNDLSRIATQGSVYVPELFGVHSFKQVHHLISTVQCNVASDVDSLDIIKATFPMGSMTGAPKIRAVQIIEALESFKRSIYSGAIGYIEPNGDFDFNVVIRSIIYNKETKTAAYAVGSALTASAIPIKEWSECKLKAKAMEQVLKTD